MSPSPPSEAAPAGVPLGALALGVTNCRRWDPVVAAVREAAGLGVRRAYLAEDVGCRDAFQLAALALDAAPEITVTLGVTNPYQRSPGALAAAAATVSELAGGRFHLGLGSSSPDIIAGQLGMEYGNRVEVMRETILSVRSCLAGQSPSGPVRVVMAAMGPIMLRLAGELADGVLLNTGTTPAYACWAIGHIHEGARRSGRRLQDLEVAVWLPVYLEPDPDAQARAAAWAAGMLSIPGQGELLLRHAGLPNDFLPAVRAACSIYPERGDREAGAAFVPENVVRTLALIGDEREVLRRMAAFVAAGVQALVVGSRPLRRLTPSLPRTSEEVRPLSPL